jgi:hypothetical protein
MPAENPTNAITNPTIPRLFIRNPTDRPYSLLNLTNSALSRPPPTLTIRAIQEEIRIILVRALRDSRQ